MENYVTHLDKYLVPEKYKKYVDHVSLITKIIMIYSIIVFVISFVGVLFLFIGLSKILSSGGVAVFGILFGLLVAVLVISISLIIPYFIRKYAVKQVGKEKSAFSLAVIYCCLILISYLSSAGNGNFLNLTLVQLILAGYMVYCAYYLKDMASKVKPLDDGDDLNVETAACECCSLETPKTVETVTEIIETDTETGETNCCCCCASENSGDSEKESEENK